MANFISSWKTSIVGVVLLLIAGLKVAGVEIPGFNTDVGTMIAAGLAALFAKDANVTGAVK